MLRVVSNMWRWVNTLGVPSALLVATASATITALVFIALNVWGLFVWMPIMFCFLGVSGRVLVSSLNRSRFLPRGEGWRLILPIFGALPLLLLSAFCGVWIARLLNQMFFHMPETFGT